MILLIVLSAFVSALSLAVVFEVLHEVFRERYSVQLTKKPLSMIWWCLLYLIVFASSPTGVVIYSLAMGPVALTHVRLCQIRPERLRLRDLISEIVPTLREVGRGLVK